MSEYQYYEFQALDRLLTPEEQETLQALSSRAHITPHRASFVYNYGDFRGGPEAVLAKYFDAMFYIANWGTWQIMFRFPKALVERSWFEPYEVEDAIAVTTTTHHLILNIEIREEEGLMGWVEGEGWLPRLLPLRDDLLAGDLRLLYLAWLRLCPNLVEYGEDEDPTEPPVPSNLGKLTPPLKTFMELVELDPDLVAAAAQISSDQRPKPAPPLEDWLPNLTEAERQTFLLKLVRREPHVDLQLINRLKELAGTQPSMPLASEQERRRFSELVAIATDVATKRQQKEQAAAKKKRIKELEALAPKASYTWDRVLDLIQVKQAHAYDEATKLLKDLRDLAEHQGQLPTFSQCLERLKADYSNRPALMK
ncbi:hypothetical protein IQ273_09760 [Nodosilinea sp. LEGE 07298]|uniref:hypothetical protein n=1 Tax=Nodosilinea sp. LEGE 07298 TaxID=2777970 RepID=UPI00188260A4|nr:hypothetical protein [Nodosilinea sp. LEGE 07298]MBE9109698.1 hypothetical protein [Nodosilinea sp. LEGE 07298]